MTRRKTTPNRDLIAVELTAESWRVVLATLATAMEELVAANASGAMHNTARNVVRRQLSDIRDAIIANTGIEE